ncbi:MAG: hypothetical protein AAF366_17640 [Pseudomonadota bacterium]
MADWRAVIRAHPAVRSYIRHRRWVRRGDVLAYGPGVSAPTFSTDGAGFRLSRWRGRAIGLSEVMASDRFGLVMGSSHVFGFGLAGDGETLSSRLAEQLDMPMANISFPEADTRSLHAVLVNLAARGRTPALVILATGGDFTRHAFTGVSDPVFGARNIQEAKPSGDTVPLGRVLDFTRLWTAATVAQARGVGAEIVLVDDKTFMDKGQPTEVEAGCGLGRAGTMSQRARFAFQRDHGAAFFAARRDVADRMGVPLIGAQADDLAFIDEYHMTGPGTARLADAVSTVAADRFMPAGAQL